MIYLGIDPGKKGAVAGVSEFYQAWVFGFDKLGESGIHSTLRFAQKESPEPIIVALEKVHSMPRQGVVSAFTFGTGYGFLRGVLVALGIPFQDVSASEWPKEFGLASRRKKGEERTKADIKRANLACAQCLFPGVEGLNIETADALLLAEYARRKFGGQKS